MILSYNWLKELVPFDMTPQELAEGLTRVGCCVEEMHEVEGDWQLVAEVTTNRPDWLCHWGVAHEIAAFTGKPLNLPEIKLPEDGAEKVESFTSVTNECPEVCKRYTARVIRGVKVAPSPEWLVKRLEALGLKSRNNVVDITNLILFEMNQPLHTFDYDQLAENRIIIRRAKDGEEFTSVFGEERKLDSSMCVIADAGRAVALAGVKGGLNSGITDDTVNVLLESAYFEQAATRRASKKTLLDSDSSYRFERGIDPGGVERASARAAQLICELAGGTIAEGIIDTNPDLATPWDVTMRFARCAKVLGISVDTEIVKKIFSGLGLEILSCDEAEIKVKVPTFRGDLTREADLIEEVARCHGYENIPIDIKIPLGLAHISRETRSLRKAREVLVGLGHHECMADTFVSEKYAEEFAPFEHSGTAGVVPRELPPLRIKNPVREDRPLMRTGLIPGLLEIRRVNRAEEASLFELNRVYIPTGTEAVDEPLHLCIIDDRGTEYVRGALETVLQELRIDGVLEVRPLAGELKGFASQTVAEIFVGETRIGLYGVVDKKVADAHDLLKSPAACEVSFSAVLTLSEKPMKNFVPLPRFPGVSRDIALVVSEEVRWADVEKIVRENDELLDSYAFASVYRDKKIGDGKKSLAFSLTYRNPERSLTDEEANELRDKMVAKLTAGIKDSALR